MQRLCEKNADNIMLCSCRLGTLLEVVAIPSRDRDLSIVHHELVLHSLYRITFSLFQGLYCSLQLALGFAKAFSQVVVTVYTLCVFIFSFVTVLFCAVLGMESRISCMLSKCFTTELHPSLTKSFASGFYTI
jgi:hypothetical protein